MAEIDNVNKHSLQKFLLNYLFAPHHHMESEIHQKCQWSNCINDAVKHAVFGARVFDAPKDYHISDSHESEHLDLCTKHIELASLQYVRVTEYELGACPNTHPNGNSNLLSDHLSS